MTPAPLWPICAIIAGTLIIAAWALAHAVLAHLRHRRAIRSREHRCRTISAMVAPAALDRTREWDRAREMAEIRRRMRNNP
jgi:hypothetical protein